MADSKAPAAAAAAAPVPLDLDTIAQGFVKHYYSLFDSAEKRINLQGLYQPTSMCALHLIDLTALFAAHFTTCFAITP